MKDGSSAILYESLDYIIDMIDTATEKYWEEEYEDFISPEEL
jgi:hypothetical protein